MSLLTVEVELDHGRVIPKSGEALPEKATGLLTIISSGQDAPVEGDAPTIDLFGAMLDSELGPRMMKMLEE